MWCPRWAWHLPPSVACARRNYGPGSRDACGEYRLVGRGLVFKGELGIRWSRRRSRCEAAASWRSFREPGSLQPPAQVDEDIVWLPTRLSCGRRLTARSSPPPIHPRRIPGGGDPCLPLCPPALRVRIWTGRVWVFVLPERRGCWGGRGTAGWRIAAVGVNEGCG